MFLLPSLLLGVGLAVVVGGKPSRIASVPIRASWLVPAALLTQVAIFRVDVPDAYFGPLHLASYGFLVAFAVANLRIRALAPVVIGMVLNAAAIAANGGRMPVSVGAAHAAGLHHLSGSNVDPTTHRLGFLGDIFALPHQLPFANVFSVGDLLIGIGVAAFIVVTSLERRENTLKPSRILEPLRTKGYRRLAAGKVVSHFGDWLTIAALIGWVYKETGSTTSVAALMLVRLVPPVLGGTIAAYVVDRLPKHRLILWIELARGTAIAIALAGVVTDQRVAVYAALGASGVLAAMSNAAVPALVPGLLPAAQLPAANAGLGMAKDGAMALGAVGAGLALSLTGVGIALMADIATFVVAAICFAGLPSPSIGHGKRAEKRPSALSYVVRNPALLILILAFASATFATGLTNATLPRLLEHQVGFGDGGYGFGLAALGAGLALGGITVGFTRVGPSAGRWIGLGLLLMAGLFALLGLSTHAPTAILIIGLIGYLDGTTDVLFETSVQREADERHYGAVFGLASAVMTSTMVGAIALAPIANRFLNTRDVLIAASLFLVLAGVIAIGMRSSRAEVAEREEEPRNAPAAERLVFPVPELAEPVSDLIVIPTKPLVLESAPPPVLAPAELPGVAAINALFRDRFREPLSPAVWEQMLSVAEIARKQAAKGLSDHVAATVDALNAIFARKLSTPLDAEDWKQLLALDELSRAQANQGHEVRHAAPGA